MSERAFPDLSVNGTPVDIGGQTFAHRSVLLEPCMDALAIKPDGIYVDGTAGGGGHSFEIARRLTTGRLIAIDQDEAAIKAASAKLAPLGERAQVVRNNFCHVADVLDTLGIDRIDGILLDLGVSSYQLDTPERGFSYMADAPLDMRMDMRAEKNAYHVVNTYSEHELRRILFDYGEERFAGRIASRIVQARADKPIETTGELTALIKAAIPAAASVFFRHTKAIFAFSSYSRYSSKNASATERSVLLSLHASAIISSICSLA